MGTVCHRQSLERTLFLFGAAALALLIPGCGSGSQTPQQAIDTQLKNNPTATIATLGKCAGRVTIDGQPPKPGSILLLILNDPKHPLTPGKVPPIYTRCALDGTFGFTTYVQGDGVTVGSYIATFCKLKPVGFAGRNGFGPPDELKNLYNDPDKNAQDPRFKVEVTTQGKVDYSFDLQVEGKEAVRSPGEHAVTTIDFVRRGR